MELVPRRAAACYWPGADDEALIRRGSCRQRRQQLGGAGGQGGGVLVEAEDAGSSGRNGVAVRNAWRESMAALDAGDRAQGSRTREEERGGHGVSLDLAGSMKTSSNGHARLLQGKGAALYLARSPVTREKRGRPKMRLGTQVLDAGCGQIEQQGELMRPTTFLNWWRSPCRRKHGDHAISSRRREKQ